MLASFHSSYLADGLRRGAFLPRGLGDPADRAAAVAAAAERPLSPIVLAELRRQNALLPESARREAHLAALAEPGAVVVVTGQQMGLWLGPLYTLHKAASAIALAKRLAAETGARVVPLFWLQTEDHDFAEIATALSPKRDGTLLHSRLPDDPARARVSIAHRTVPDEIVNCLDDLERELAGRPFADETMALLRQHYRAGTGIAAAFAGVLATLFAEDGLVLFDPRNAATAPLAAPLLERAVREWQPIEKLLLERVGALLHAGFAAPIEIRFGVPLPFFHADAIEGPRQRLDAPVEDDALRLLRDTPLRWSCSALLRPLVQDALLPVAAYVGGPAEVGYLAQLQPLYDYFGVTPALVAPRAQLRLIPTVARRALDGLGVDVGALATLTVPDVADDAPSDAWLAELDQRLDAIAARDPLLGRTLAPAIERTRGTIRQAMARFGERYLRAATEQSDSRAARLRRARAWLLPDGGPQERTLCFVAFAAEVGLTHLTRAIVDAIDPLQPALREVAL